MKDYIRKAAKLADGFRISQTDDDRLETYYFPTGMGHTVRIDHAPQCWLDALAAQLVRQVDDTEAWVETMVTETSVYDYRGEHKTEGIDRTMNTIKAIVDSGVLK